MNHDQKVNLGHVFVALGKYILVLSQEFRECSTDWGAGKGADPGRSLRFLVIEEYLFQPFNRLCNHLLFFYAHDL